MDEECEAPPCSEADEYECFDDIEGRNIELDFGTVEIFKERTQHITFYRPMTDDDIIYEIKKNHTVKTIKSSFELDHYKGVLKPNQDFKMAVTYKPTLASMKDIEVYEYTDNDFELIKITLHGVAVGPHCTLSAKNLEFYKIPEKRQTEHKIEINNQSAATAYFKVDHAQKDVFSVEPLEGKVKPNGYEYLTIKFRPSKPGVYARKLFCLVWNSEPQLLNVFGIYSKKPGMDKVGSKYCSNDQSFGFKAYLDDSITVRKDQLPFTISPSYLNFECVLINEIQSTMPQVTTFTNNLNCTISVDWDRHKKSKIFKITPNTVKVPPKSSVPFQVEFYPEENYNVFQETMLAQVDVIDTRKSVLCYTSSSCTLRAQGHSFPHNQGWIAHVEVLPEVVYWQPCAPGEPCSTTFLLRNRSHLPVLYQLLPPKYTNITVKPMMGKFYNTEIIAAQLQTEPLKVKTYIEEWKLIVNGLVDRQIPIYFHGETCVPTIEIGKRNRINAGSVQDGSQKEVHVMMKNTSFYSLNYQFRLIKNSVLQILPATGTLPANESTKLLIKVKGIQCAPKTETFHCVMRIVDGNGAISGESHETDIVIYTECSYSELCACPSSQDFGCLPFGRKIKTEFEAVNFGDTPIFFQTCQTGEEQLDSNFRIKPCFGEVRAKESKRFGINGIVSNVGKQTLHFGYYNRMVRDSPLVTGEPITLFELTYCAEFPVIQVEEIVEHNFGGLFAKRDFYEHYLQVARLNKIFREIKNDETVELQLRLPEFELQKKEFYIQLALTNITDFDTTVTIKRKKICDCQLEEISAGISERKKGFSCPHRASLDMDLQDTRFLAKTTRFLTMRVKYCLKERTQMCFTINMTNNRVVEMYFDIYSVPPDMPRLSRYGNEFDMKLNSVYLGTKVAPVQMFWMYNNTGHLLNFEFDTEEVLHLCRIEGFNVLEILNPVDQIMPYQCKALLVKFHPIEMKTYSVTIEAKYYKPGEEATTFDFLIEGDGVMVLEKELDNENLPRVGKFTSNFPVTLSLEYIHVKMLPVWSRRKELIFIKNNSRGKVLHYVWGTVKIDDVIEISTESNFGVLKPKEIHPVVITIKSFAKPCVSAFLLTCEIVNYTDSVVHKITKEKNQEAENRINEFMQGEPPWAKRPVNPINIHPKPGTVFATVVIKVTTIHTKDLDQFMDPNLQIKQYPNQSLENIPKSLLKKYNLREKTLPFPEKGKVQLPMSVNERTIFCRIIEDILSEVLFSDKMKCLLEKSIKVPMHKYPEFVMDDKKIMERKSIKMALSNEDIEYYRRQEIDNFFNQLSVTQLSNILQTLIYDGTMKMVQCYKPECNPEDLQGQIEKEMFTCKVKTCSCNRPDESN